MLRLTAFFLSLVLALSLGLGSAAHAAESVGCIEVAAAAGIGHADGDGDQVPGDANKDYPHHHAGCHGHHIGVPVTPDAVAPASGQSMRPLPENQHAIALPTADPALRPPRA